MVACGACFIIGFEYFGGVFCLSGWYIWFRGGPVWWIDKAIMMRWCVLLLGFCAVVMGCEARTSKRAISDHSVHGYLTERTCWWNEVCKEEFQTLFRCKCPAWSFCRAPGRYYNAYCAMTATGYIWTQPGWGGDANGGEEGASPAAAPS